MKNKVNELYWVANYIGGDKLLQYEGLNGSDYAKENKYADINREKLERFDLYKTETGKPIYSVYLREGQKLIFRRRTIKQIGHADIIVYLVGWQMTLMLGSGPRNLIVINYIHQDGSIALDGARNNLQLLPIES